MWALNDSNIVDTYETNDFYMPDDYTLSSQWEFDNGYSESEIDLATVLMNLKEDYNPARYGGCGGGGGGGGGDDDDGYYRRQTTDDHLDGYYRRQTTDDHHDGSGAVDHQQQHWQFPQSVDDDGELLLRQQQQQQHHQQQQQQQQQQRVLVYDPLDGGGDYTRPGDQNYLLLPAVLDVGEELCKANDASAVEKKRAGRPRGTKAKRSKAEPKLSRIWEFIRDLLLDAQYCPTYICWENYEEGRFRFVQSDKVAKLWGKFKRNERMNYEKFSRAMRYYYKTGVLLPVQGKRLVYKFGPKATGWHTDNPNFKYAF